LIDCLFCHKPVVLAISRHATFFRGYVPLRYPSLRRGKNKKYYLYYYHITKLYNQLVMGQGYKMAVIFDAKIGKSDIAKMRDRFSNLPNQVFCIPYRLYEQEAAPFGTASCC
jgi:hypothetical protein